MAAAHDQRSPARGETKALAPQPEPGQPQDEPGPGADRDQQRDQRPPRRSWIARRKLLTAVLALCAAAVIAAGVAWWLNARNYEDTDDAFIDARPSAISPQVSAAIVDVPVTDNEVVEPGQPLARLDDRDYRAAQAEAEAKVAQAQAAIGSSEAQIAAQQATIDQRTLDVTQAQAALAYSKDEYARAQTLLTKGAGTLQQAQQTHSDLIQKQAAFDGAQAALAQAKKQLAVLIAQKRNDEAQLAQAQAELAQANVNLSRTVLKAPFKGRVTQLTAAKGSYATPGQTLMLIVPHDVWVTANFRETQLADMHPGQPAQLCIDAYGRCFPGKVNSIQAGSGTAFSALPAENATGNYVKVVQRVPVKLVFNKQPDLELGPGMSVTPSVKVR